MPESLEQRDIANAKLSAAAGSALVKEAPWNYCFMLHPANSYRAYDQITLVQSDRPWLPGDFITAAGALATSPGSIIGINCLHMSTANGPKGTNAAVRDCEVGDPFLQYGTMDVAAVNTQLETRGIIVRQGVLANVAGGSFDPNAPGDIISGIPPGTSGASWTPDTLEAADPAEKADDHGRVSAERQQENRQRLEQQRAAAPPRSTPPSGTGTPPRAPRPPRGENP